MTPAELRALLADATKGPWSRTTSGDPHWLREVRGPDGSGVAWCGDSDEHAAHADAAAIVALRNHGEALTALWEAAEMIAKYDYGEMPYSVISYMGRLRDAIAALRKGGG